MVDFTKHAKQVSSKIVAENALNAVVITGASNIFYVSGSDAPTAVIIYEDGSVVALATRLEYLRASAEIRVGELYAYARQGDFAEHERVLQGDLYDAVKLLIPFSKDGKVGLAGVAANSRQQWEEKIGVKFIDITSELIKLRRTKDETELNAIKQAIRLAEQAMRKAIDALERGVTESDIAAEILNSIVRNGAQPAFQPIVAFGEHAAQPHAKLTLRTLQPGDIIKIDLGAKAEGYCSDITRTFAFGKESEQQRKLFRAVIKAQEMALGCISVGVKASDVHLKAYEVFKEEGVSKYFNHGLGHGVGIEVHEEPYLNSESTTPLAWGDVLTVEPGVYLPGYGGIRIEDMVLVTDEGPQLLTS
ncbi:MAG: M24 family metallopeptidase, partial [Thermofilaceae archaeon]